MMERGVTTVISVIVCVRRGWQVEGTKDDGLFGAVWRRRRWQCLFSSDDGDRGGVMTVTVLIMGRTDGRTEGRQGRKEGRKEGWQPN
jgi:hypothetical protein